MAQPWEKVCRDRLTLGASSYRSLLTHGVVAQLGERLNGIQEVVSSILSSSTRFQGFVVIRTLSFCAPSWNAAAASPYPMKIRPFLSSFSAEKRFG